MLLLALDTSTPAVTVAVHDGRRVFTEETVDARRHGELLAALISRTLATAGRAPGQLSAVAAGCGPGPFTGLRIGLATAAAIADALDLPRYAVCSLDLLAHAAADDGDPVAVATDARRREVYWAVYRGGRRVTGPQVGPPAAAAAAAREAGARRVAGEGPLLYPETFVGLSVVAPRYPSAAVLAELVAPRAAAGEPADQLVPRYLRRPDAVPPGPAKPVRPR